LNDFSVVIQTSRISRLTSYPYKFHLSAAALLASEFNLIEPGKKSWRATPGSEHTDYGFEILVPAAFFESELGIKIHGDRKITMEGSTTTATPAGSGVFSGLYDFASFKSQDNFARIPLVFYCSNPDNDAPSSSSAASGSARKPKQTPQQLAQAWLDALRQVKADLTADSSSSSSSASSPALKKVKHS